MNFSDKFRARFQVGLLPALCVSVALVSAIVIVHADEPGSSAADETGMGNSYEYPNSNNQQAKESRDDSQSHQQAGTVAPSGDKNPGACAIPSPTMNQERPN